MKTLKHIIILLTVVLLVASMNGCKKDFDKINDDPNSPKDVPTSYLLTGAQKGIMDNTCDYWWNGYVGNQLAQYWASNSYTEESRYLFRAGTTSIYWENFYAGGSNDLQIEVGGMEELQTIIDKCTSDPAKYSPYGDPKNQIAIATALKVWLLQNMTDTWGDIPYKEALQGVKNTAPTFDKQEDIYNGLFAELDNAYAHINDGGAAVQGDMVYGGDISLWKKFMNSLKLRLALRIADRNPTLAGTKITEAIDGGIFTSNADNALFLYTTTSPNVNPVYHEFTELNRKDFCSSSTLMDQLQALNDPRISDYYRQVKINDSTFAFVGRPYGQDDVNASSMPISTISQSSSLVRQPDFPGIFLDYAQVEFMLAEAAERGMGGASDAAAHYASGITASMDFWSTLDVAHGGAGISAGDVAAYLAQPSVDYASAPGTWRQKIAKQKWMALYMQGIQGWVECRRLDFSILKLPVDGVLAGSGVPRRMLYPLEEQTLNPKGYGAAISNMGSDDLSTRVWWDVN